MKNFTIPILFAGLAAVLVLLGGLLGGVSFGLMIKRIFMYGLLMGGLGFILTFLLEKFSGESLSEPSTEMRKTLSAAGEDREDSFRGLGGRRRMNRFRSKRIGFLIIPFKMMMIGFKP